MAIIYCTGVSQDAFENAYYSQSNPGDTIVLPTGAATWGNSSRPNAGIIYISTPVTVVGQGTGTVITLDDSGATYGNSVIALWASGMFSGMTIIGSNVNPVTAFGMDQYQSFSGGFRLTNITYNGRGGTAYFAYVGEGVNNGLIDNCIIGAANGQTELIFTRGPSNSWQLPPALGSANAIYVEDCLFYGTGYVCDANSNARIVLRNNTISGAQKIDGHGFASNSPARSVREMEIYNNKWVSQSASWAAMEIRGGSAIVFNNTTTNSVGNSAWIFLTDYGYQAQWPNYNYIYQTPFDYPLPDQIGVGRDPKVAHSQPAYVFGNLKASSPWPRSFEQVQQFTLTNTTGGQTFSIGATNIACASTSLDLHSGNAISIAGDTNLYLLASTAFQTSQNLILQAPGLLKAIPGTNTTITAGAVTLYQQQVSNSSATFTESDVIKNNRDFYADAGFDVLTGVSIGTTAQMNALTPTVTGYGFWVTDQGSWNTTVPSGTAGELYTWSGGWNLYYVPYTYPHPLRGGGTSSGSPIVYIYKRLGSHLKLYGLAAA